MLALLAGAIGSIASINARDFYETLSRPAWAPPGWIFGPVWTVLYVLMGVAAWLVWRERPVHSATVKSRRLGLTLFVVQLGLNALWTWLFFRWRTGAWALIDIVILWIAIAIVMALFARVHRLAALLVAPYLLWVGYATALTMAIWLANAGRL